MLQVCGDGDDKTCLTGEKSCDPKGDLSCNIPGRCQEIPIENTVKVNQIFVILSNTI
jgi:hypothetical protein